MKQNLINDIVQGMLPYLKKYKYPPKGMDDAVQTVMTQCELWTDNYNFEKKGNVYSYNNHIDGRLLLVVEDRDKYK